MYGLVVCFTTTCYTHMVVKMISPLVVGSTKCLQPTLLVWMRPNPNMLLNNTMSLWIKLLLNSKFQMHSTLRCVECTFPFLGEGCVVRFCFVCLSTFASSSLS